MQPAVHKSPKSIVFPQQPSFTLAYVLLSTPYATLPLFTPVPLYVQGISDISIDLGMPFLNVYKMVCKGRPQTVTAGVSWVIVPFHKDFSPSREQLEHHKIALEL